MSFGKHFKDNDFTLYEKNGDIFSLHMKFDNFFRNQNLPAMIGGSKSNHKNINDGLSEIDIELFPNPSSDFLSSWL